MNPVETPTSSPSARGGALGRWLDERYQLEGLRTFLSHKSVPVTKHFLFYYLGGVTLWLFIVQVLSGILLLLYYRAGADSSYESVRFLVSEVRFGWLVRSVHSWSANLMVLSAFLHMFSVYFTRAYQKPRELTWVSGFVLLVLALGFGFSGYLLPWNELAFFATKVGTDIVGAVPVIGEPMLVMLRGGEDVTGATLSRFFGIHVAILPGIFTVVLAMHLLMIQRQGMHEPPAPRGEKPKTMPFFPNFMMRDLLLWIVVLNILAVLAVFFPWELGKKADLFAPAPAGIKPEWYFMFMFQTLKLLPAHIAGIEGEILGILAFGFAGFAWMLVPFLDRRPGNSRRMRVLGAIVVVYIAIFTVLGWVLS